MKEKKQLIKRIIFSVLLLLTIFVSFTNCDLPDYDPKVYVTASGRSYHRHSCSYIKRAKTVYWIYKSEAEAQGYNPCNVCKP